MELLPIIFQAIHFWDSRITILLKFTCNNIGNHRGVIGEVGFTDIREYRYWNAEQKTVDIDGFLQDLKVS